MEHFPKAAVSYALSHSTSPIALIGSANLALQGMNLPFTDLDFLTDNNNLKHFAQLLCGAPSAPHGFLEFWADFQGTIVNFTSYENNPLREAPLGDVITATPLEDISVPCLTLQKELAFYEKAGREKDLRKVDMIRTFLSKEKLFQT